MARVEGLWACLKRLLLYLCFVKETRAFNHAVFVIGRRNSRLLRAWFAAGALCGVFAALVSVGLLAAQALHNFHPQQRLPGATANPPYLGIVVPGVNVPWADIVHISLATSISVGLHELGHALAAASEGVPTEHIAVFAVAIFAGAFVALDRDGLQLLSPSRLLRIYCAGVWHNVACCAGCWLLLKLLPWALFPLCRYGNGLQVLAVSSSSPLAGHLTSGDVIKVMDDSPVLTSQDWFQRLQKPSESGFCVPSSIVGSPCSEAEDSRLYFTTGNVTWCVASGNVSTLRRCAEFSTSELSTCPEGHLCMQPKLAEGEAVLRITFAAADDHTCKLIPPAEFGTSLCSKELLFVGRPVALAVHLQLADCVPRFRSASWLARHLECLLSYIFRISAALAILNSLPVFCLDGEEIARCILRWCLRSRRKQRAALRCLLLGGSVLLVAAIAPPLALIVAS